MPAFYRAGRLSRFSFGNALGTAFYEAAAAGLILSGPTFIVERQSETRVRLVWSEPIAVTAALRARSTYVFSPALEVVAVSVAGAETTTIVDLETTEQRTTIYGLSVLRPGLDPLIGSFNGLGVAPELVRAVALGAQRIRATFSEPMRDDAALRSPTSYTLTPALGSTARNILAVTPVAGDALSVDITVSGTLTPGAAAYTLAAATAADRAGNPVAGAAVPVEVPPTPGEVPDHVTAALDRLIAQYRGDPNIRAILRIAAERLVLLDTQVAMATRARAIDGAFGAWLDDLGAFLGLARGGVDDARYRRRLTALAGLLAGRGRPNAVEAALLELANGATVTHAEHYPAGITARMETIPLDDGRAFARILRRGVPAGVHVVLEHVTSGVVTATFAETENDAASSLFAETENDAASDVWTEAT